MLIIFVPLFLHFASYIVRGGDSQP